MLPCPLVFETLGELEISAEDSRDESIFFAKSNLLKKIKIITNFSLGLSGLTIASTWPSLTNVTLNLNWTATNEVIELVRSLSNLQQLCFDISDNRTTDDLERSLSGEHNLSSESKTPYRKLVHLTRIQSI